MAARKTLLVREIFKSIQGETSHVGLPYTFVRFTGCDLRCTYCDTAYAFKGGQSLGIDEIMERVRELAARRVLLTGGEPLLQKNILPLLQALRAGGFEVSIETHGQVLISEASAYARIVMDLKTPSSGESNLKYRENLRWLKAGDEIKFVIAGREDYEWSRAVVLSGELPHSCEVLFSPTMAAVDSPGEFKPLAPRQLAEWILADGLHVRMQLQIHKLIWGHEAQGV